MSLQTRLEALVTTLGADIKTLTNRFLPATKDLTANTDRITTITIVDDNTATAGWPNRWEWKFKPFGASVAQLTSWFNEYGELRITPAKVNTVALRIFGKTNALDPAHTGNVFEIQDNRDDRVVKVGIDAEGNVVTAGAVTRAVPGGPTLQTGYLRLTSTAPVPAGTPSGILIVRDA